MFGIWNSITKRFVFGIHEETASKASRALFDKIGKQAYLWRYEVKKIPEGWVNPPNPSYKKKGSIHMSIFEKYANKINQEELAASQQEIQDNASSGDYPEIPVGKYEVKVEKLECKLSKNNNPMVSIWFKILAGDHKNSMIFYNGVFKEDWMRHRVAKILSDLLDDGDRSAEINIILKSGIVKDINEFCMDIHEAIDGEREYLLDYGLNKGYNTYKIEEVYEVE